ncbi:hypothetical protein CFBP1573P_06216 [Pseudomonas syringae pv. persicae]|uniref:Uncharacterized protein n=1 Tax=Pseudomonas syringae pv. persicae TaxID=237306 RepID=A0AB38EMK4_9PSED|nr:hypothetical protein NCPPB2254_05699 [Pseudomonas syringae pv. persicae]SOQ16679.1 hypothetical protein CFBP1573P_06216 [Pseudomonas syringae pv. persicae]
MSEVLTVRFFRFLRAPLIGTEPVRKVPRPHLPLIESKAAISRSELSVPRVGTVGYFCSASLGRR